MCEGRVRLESFAEGEDDISSPVDLIVSHSRPAALDITFLDEREKPAAILAIENTGGRVIIYAWNEHAMAQQAQYTSRLVMTGKRCGDANSRV